MQPKNKVNPFKTKSGKGSDLEGQLLLAMPNMGDPRFENAVIYLCRHARDGAMGIVLNKPMDNLSFEDLLTQVGIEDGENAPIRLPLRRGGPVETQRGFVIHNAGFENADTTHIGSDIYVSATLDILKAMARSRGPSEAVLALGYAGWTAGQLDSEIQANAWLNLPGSNDIIFHTPIDEMWRRTLENHNIDPGLLSARAGHA